MIRVAFFIILQIITAYIGVACAGSYQFSGENISVSKIKLQFNDNSDREFSEITSSPESDWLNYDLGEQKLGVVEPGVWLKFSIINTSASETVLLVIDNPLLDHIDYYVENDQGQLQASGYVGDTQPFALRDIKAINFALQLKLERARSYTIFLQIKHAGAMRIPIEIISPANFYEDSVNHEMLSGVIFGILLTIALVNLTLAIATRGADYAWYALLIILASMLIFGLRGLYFKYLWPENIWLQQYSVVIFANLSVTVYLLFSQHILNLNKMAHWVKYCSTLFILLTVLCSATPLVFSLSESLTISLPIIIASSLFMFVMSVRQWHQSINSKLYALSIFILLAVMIIGTLIAFGYLSLNISLDNLLSLGVVNNAVILSILLAIRYANEQKAKTLAQKQMLKSANEIQRVQAQHLAEKEEAQEELESRVSERTFELQVTLRELAERNQELEELSNRDPLTNARNRRYFDQRINAEWKRCKRDGNDLSLILLDIDHFKNVNDTHGHMAGDDALRFITKIIQYQLRRPADILCRFGGEEFAIILPSTPVTGAQMLAENILQHTESTPMPLNTAAITMTLSAGISTLTSSESANDLIEQADQALYLAKERGRNRVQVYQSEIGSSS